MVRAARLSLIFPGALNPKSWSSRRWAFLIIRCLGGDLRGMCSCPAWSDPCSLTLRRDDSRSQFRPPLTQFPLYSSHMDSRSSPRQRRRVVGGLPAALSSVAETAMLPRRRRSRALLWPPGRVEGVILAGHHREPGAVCVDHPQAGGQRCIRQAPHREHERRAVRRPGQPGA